MTKQEEIDKWMAKPIEIGDTINVRVKFTKTTYVTTGKGKNKITLPEHSEESKSSVGIVIDIIDDANLGIVYATKIDSWSLPTKEHDKVKYINSDGRYPYNVSLIRAKYATPDTRRCGAYPFKKQPVNINFHNQNIEILLSHCGYVNKNDGFNVREIKTVPIDTKHESEMHIAGKTFGGVNFDPYVTDSNGERKYYQRGLVWTLEQKQALIASIFNWIEIGKFVFRYKNWEQLTKEMEEDGHGYDFECIDGKQRMNAIIEFVQNKLSDSDRNYWSDLSGEAQQRFLNYDRFAFGKLDEGTTDEMVVATFLNLNFTGVPMSIDHIKYVQSINL